MPTALVTAVSGIGDIVRTTPLVRVFHGLGFEVDVLIAPDYLETWTLLEGAPEIRRLYYVASPWSALRGERLDGLADQRYDVATFTALGGALRRRVRAEEVVSFDQLEWRRDGDSACIATIAATFGWDGPLPPPIVRHSGRTFDVSPRTIALHPGCKPRWGFKRWHGFAALAGELEDVVVVGTSADHAHDPTAYFDEAPRWPAHVRSYVDALDLADTAALISQCGALVSNDSGLMHVGAALGVPTFGIFGLTSPRREAMPLATMHPITHALPCEAACRRRPWGRTGCEHDLACLRTLTPQAVIARMRALLPSREWPVAAEVS